MPKTRSQWIEFLVDQLGPPPLWPGQIRHLLLSKRHPKNRDRFTITVFFLANGMNPVMILEFFQENYSLDDAAFRQIRWIINKYPTSNWMGWNTAHGRSV